MWAVPRDWPGETVFIVAGGPSVATQNLDLLRGRRVIVINRSYLVAPWADVLFFGDHRFWVRFEKEIAGFKGEVVTVSPVPDKTGIHVCRKDSPPGLSRDPRGLTMRRTSLTAAINLAVHKGADRIVLLGADGKTAPDGRNWHHEPHPWAPRPDSKTAHRRELSSIVESLKAMNVTALNASPDSAFTMFRMIRLEDVVAERSAA